jgi:transcriptional regulator with XRE-family HTH domain
MEQDFKITLRAARTNLGLTRVEAAGLLEIHHETLARYEHDSTNIPRGVFIKFDKVFGIPAENIYFGKEKDFYRLKRKQLKEVIG